MTLDLFSSLPVGSQPVETSERAADRLEQSGKAGNVRWKALLFLATVPDCTADELAETFGVPHNSTSPRLTELMAMGFVERLDGKYGQPIVKRKTRSGASAYAHRITELGREAVKR